MRIKLDENMPGELAALLEELGHEVETVPEEILSGKPDAVIRRVARIEGRFLITQDKKFVDARRWTDDPGAGVMLVRIEDETRLLLIRGVTRAFQTEPIETWAGNIVVVTANKVRVRPLKREK